VLLNDFRNFLRVDPKVPGAFPQSDAALRVWFVYDTRLALCTVGSIGFSLFRFDL